MLKKILFTYLLLPSSFIYAQDLKSREIIKSESGLDITIENEIDAYNNQIIEIAKSNNFKLDAPQFYIGSTPIYYKSYNRQSGQMLQANKLFPGGDLGLNVTANDIQVGIWDGGKVISDHVELVGRITFGDASEYDNSFSSHASHVTGTVIASGVSASRIGIAPGATAYVHNWSSDTAEMTEFARTGGLVSNHSYGYVADNLDASAFGKYDDKSRAFDLIMNSNPYYLPVIASGNDANDNSIVHAVNNFGYDLLTGACVSKNSIVVGAINGISNLSPEMMIAGFSNGGPTDDGRIKPEVVAKGVAVNSVGIASTTSYSSSQGTSMAAPAIAGLVALMQSHHKDVYNSYMKSHVVRGLIIHSAVESNLGHGPDYKYGFGIPNAVTMANIISDTNRQTSIFETSLLTNNSIYQKDFTTNTVQNLIFTIAWNDPAFSRQSGTNNDRTPHLVNDLDLKVQLLSANDEVLNTYYPWKLNYDNVFGLATNTSTNDVDNVEKLEITAAPAGRYRIVVSHKGTLARAQEFSLVGSLPQGVLSTQTFDKVNLKLYPNPATEQLFIEGADLELLNNATVEIYSIDGKLAKRVNTNGYGRTEINISDLTSGFYSVKLNSKSGSFTTKFIKK